MDLGHAMNGAFYGHYDSPARGMAPPANLRKYWFPPERLPPTGSLVMLSRRGREGPTAPAAADSLRLLSNRAVTPSLNSVVDAAIQHLTNTRRVSLTGNPAHYHHATAAAAMNANPRRHLVAFGGAIPRGMLPLDLGPSGTKNNPVKIPIDGSPAVVNTQRDSPPVVRRTLKLRKCHTFAERVEQLKEFKRINGHINISQTGKNSSLGNWMNTQRTQYKLLKKGKKATINEEKIKTLESIGFVWNLAFTWDEMYQKLREHKERYGNVDIPTRDKNRQYNRLGKWLYTQRQRYQQLQKGKKSPLKPEQVRLLDELGVNWDKMHHGNTPNNFDVSVTMVKTKRDIAAATLAKAEEAAAASAGSPPATCDDSDDNSGPSYKKVSDQSDGYSTDESGSSLII